MYCRACGKENPDHSQFCNSCGAPLQDMQSPQQVVVINKGLLAGSGYSISAILLIVFSALCILLMFLNWHTVDGESVKLFSNDAVFMKCNEYFHDFVFRGDQDSEEYHTFKIAYEAYNSIRHSLFPLIGAVPLLFFTTLLMIGRKYTFARVIGLLGNGVALVSALIINFNASTACFCMDAHFKTTFAAVLFVFLSGANVLNTLFFLKKPAD